MHIQKRTCANTVIFSINIILLNVALLLRHIYSCTFIYLFYYFCTFSNLFSKYHFKIRYKSATGAIYNTFFIINERWLMG